MTICVICKQEKLLKDFSFSSQISIELHICKRCLKYLTKEERATISLYHKSMQTSYLMDSLKINGCAICGFHGSNSLLHFHHTNPEDKKFNLSISSLNKPNSMVIDELNKCILLCKRCHNMMHSKNKSYRKYKIRM